MKIKILASFAFALSAIGISAQKYAGTKMYDRIGHGQDSIEVLNNLSLYQESYKAKNYPEAYEALKFVFEKAPLAQVRLYTE